MQKKQNVYSKLFSNTIIFAIGSFSSKILVLILLPLYTRALSKAEYGTVDLIVQLENLLLPLVTLSIAEGIIRFGLDKDYPKKKVFSTGIVVIVGGIAVFTVFAPLIARTDYVKGYGTLFYIYMITASFKLVCAEFVRSKGLVKLYAVNGLITTASMIGFNVLFLIGLKWGISGYLLAIILSDAISIVFLFFTASLYKYFSFSSLDKGIAKEMLKYSIPLIPATIMWWVTNVSDRFLVKYFMGPDANGLYSVAYKIPTIITSVYAMFNSAWNMSAITEHHNKDSKKFYKNVFDANSSVLYVLAGGIILFIVPLTKLFIGPEFQDAYLYSPILVVATIFTCMCSFLSSIYAATKKTVNSFITSLMGAVANIVLNLILIPRMGLDGASLATLISYYAVFVFRMIDIQRVYSFKYLPGKIILNFTLLMGMMASVIFINKYIMYIPLVILFAFVFLINFPALCKAASKVLPDKIKRHISFLN